MSERRTLLLNSIQALVRTAELHGADTLPLDKVLEAAADVVELFRDGDIPGSCRDLARGVETLEAEYRRFMSVYEQDQAEVPGQPFWKCIERVAGQAKAARPRVPLRLEPVATLVKQGVGPGQICRMYGWVNDDGVPETWKLDEEIASPGKHVGPDFVPPKERVLQEREREQEAIQDRVLGRLSDRAGAKEKPAPESVEQLIKEGVSASQISRMTKLTIEEIDAEADRLGLPRPAENYANPVTHRHEMDKPLADEDRRALDAQQANPTRRPAAKPTPKAKGKGKGKPAKKTTKSVGVNKYTEAKISLDQQIADLADRGLDADGIMEEMAANPDVTQERIERVLGAAVAG